LQRLRFLTAFGMTGSVKKRWGKKRGARQVCLEQSEKTLACRAPLFFILCTTMVIPNAAIAK